LGRPLLQISMSVYCRGTDHPTAQPEH
jgi:hypothetical protein